MMILLENFFYLTLIILCSLLFFYIIKIIYLYIKQCINLKNITPPKKEIYNIVPTSKTAKIFLLFFIMSNFSLQMVNRDKWVNKHTIHHDAKEYFATNLSLQFYRKILNSIFEIDSSVMIPLNKFSEYLYNKGEKLLPKDDGERYFWRYYFHNYFYIRGADGYVPDYDPYHPKPVTKQQTEIFESMYEVIKGLATSKIEDKKVNEEKYKFYIATAQYYSTYRFVPYSEYVISRLSDRRKIALHDEKFMQKSRDVLDWTLRFQKKYRQNKNLKNFIEKEAPILGVSYYIVIDDMALDILFNMIIDKKLDCSSRYIDIYIDSAKNLVSNESPLYYMSKPQQDIVMDSIFNHMYYKTIIYMLDKQCNRKIELEYPSDEWIKNELPLIKEQWLNKKIAKPSNGWLLNL